MLFKISYIIDYCIKKAASRTGSSKYFVKPDTASIVKSMIFLYSYVK